MQIGLARRLGAGRESCEYECTIFFNSVFGFFFTTQTLIQHSTNTIHVHVYTVYKYTSYNTE